MTLVAEWVDSGYRAQEPANSAYPDGVKIDLSQGAKWSCVVELALYPAPRCGYFIISCNRCGHRAMVTAAGRRDDPRSVRLACKR